MNIEELRDYCLSKPYTTEGFPFDETTLVFKVCDKMYLLTDTEGELFMNVKCQPEKALELREEYLCVSPGYHMNKKHWNTVKLNGSVSDSQIKEWIDNSYSLVISMIPKKIKTQLDIK